MATAASARLSTLLQMAKDILALYGTQDFKLTQSTFDQMCELFKEAQASGELEPREADEIAVHIFKLAEFVSHRKE
jgi:hypothetical protein